MQGVVFWCGMMHRLYASESGRLMTDVKSGRLKAEVHLRRRFAWVTLCLSVLMALLLGWLLSSVLTSRMLLREGEVSRDFIQNLLKTDGSSAYLSEPTNPELREKFLQSMEHLSFMQDAVRANAYLPDGTVIWSTDASLMGQRFPVNEELDTALRGELVVHSGSLGAHQPQKAEHVGLSADRGYFVESYIPIVEGNHGAVLGVMELYKVPQRLNEVIGEAVVQLWVACAGCAFILFAALYGLMAKADSVIHRQRNELDEAQALSSAMELAGAVAHNLRNPLASIRVSSEMLQTAGSPDPAELLEHAQDIQQAVDRANRWITELVRVSQMQHLLPESTDLGQAVQVVIAEMQTELSNRQVTMLKVDVPPVQVHAHRAMLQQILVSLVANALDAMPSGGTLSVGCTTGVQSVQLWIQDTGTGLDVRARSALFRPFFSTKSGGLGIGLALVRRMLVQWGGRIELDPGTPSGTVVRLTFLVSRLQPQE
jgi:two-component system, NtrC family, sensor histidine kinase HydH